MTKKLSELLKRLNFEDTLKNKSLLNYREDRRGLANIIRYKIKMGWGFNFKIANLHFALFLTLDSEPASRH